MIKLFKEEKNKLVIIENENDIFSKIEERMWIHLDEPSSDEVIMLCKKINFNQDLLLNTLDDEEMAHLDTDDDLTLIIFDIPLKVEETFETVPLAIIYNDKYYVTICTKEINWNEFGLNKIKKLEPHKHVRTTLKLLQLIVSKYISSLKYLDSKRNDLENSLHSSMKNKELLDLMALNKTFVYFSTSLNANKVVLGKLKRLPEYKQYEADFELIEDVEIENNQAVEMCSIYRDILAGMMDAFASIISNNLNIVMKVLAIITLVISIPTTIASLFGMNVKVPLQHNDFGFWIVLILSLLLSLLGAWILFVYTSRISRTKKSKK